MLGLLAPPVLVAVAAGASVVVQQVLNIALRTAPGSAARLGFASHLVGVLYVAPLALAPRDPLA